MNYENPGACMALPVAEKVANGAQMLDERRPGWYRNINLETLDISNGCDCICGQLGKLEKEMWGDFASRLANESAVECYSYDVAWAGWVHAHGFAACDGVTDEWEKAIQARLDADALVVSTPVETREEVLV